MHTLPVRRWCRAALAGLALCGAIAVAPEALAQEPAAALRARHAALHDALATNPFRRPLVLESSDSAGTLRGDVYARIEQPFAVAGNTLQVADHWCDILLLHLNVQQCQVGRQPEGAVLDLVAGSKYDQSPANAYRFRFAYDVAVARADYLQVVLHADEGPLGTRHYRIVLEVVGLEDGQSFLHLSYAYDYGLVAGVAMQAYLATSGRNKVGFSIVGSQADGEPRYIGGTRGVVERNTMRYYLAIQTYLDTLTVPPAQRAEQRLTDWFAGIERYPAQLHEIERERYLALKHEQLRRHVAGSPL